MALLLQLTQKLAQGFPLFWTLWPRKVAKLEAEKAWKQVVTPDVEPLIWPALDWQVPVFEQRDPERIPHAATWLRGRRWEDEPPKPKAPTVTPGTVTRFAQLGAAPSAQDSEALRAARRRLAEEWGQQ